MRAPILPPPIDPSRRKRKRKSLLLGFLGFGFAATVVLFLAGSAAAGFLLWWASKDLPDYESLAKYEPPVMTRIHAHDGQLIAEYARERRIFVPINTIPKLIIDAFLSAEDKRFYEHGGLDFIGIARAGYKYVLNASQGGSRRAEGASTITQQVAKNFLLTSERTFDRKVKEAILALRIERAYPKDKILELYLNEIYLGIGAYGVASAALNYFSKELKDITAEEAAYLAALPKAPNNYHPFKKTKEAKARRDWILDEMKDNGVISGPAAEVAKAKPLIVNIRPLGAHIFSAEFFAEEVRRALLAEYKEDGLYGGGMSVRTTLDPNLQRIARRTLIDGLVEFDRSRGWRGPVQRLDMRDEWGAALAQMETPSDIQPWRLGVVLEVQRAKVAVGLRPARQADSSIPSARETIDVNHDEMKWAGRFGASDKARGPSPKQPSDILAVGDVIYVAPKDGGGTATKDGGTPANQVWSLMQIPEVGGGLVAMDPHNGRVLAIAGGFSFAISQFDRAVQARRQPGSAFKPLVYATALDNGYKPTSIVLDAPIEIEQGPGKDVWRPENYNKDKSYGPSTLRIGIEKSRNQMTVRLAQDMGMPMIIEYTKRFGVYDDLMPVLAMSLGAGETTLLRMATAYSVLANGGKEVKPTLVDRIQDRWGKTVWQHDGRRCDTCKAERWQGQAEPDLVDERRQIIDPHTAYQMTSMLEGVVQRGTATIVKQIVPGVPLAGKTGTTNESKDTWFVGYAPDLVVGVYVGYDTPKPMGKSATGGQVSAPIFGNFMKAALADKKPVPFRIPSGLKFVRVNAYTGMRVGAGDPQAVMEAFKPYEEPDDASSFLGYEDPATVGGGAGVAGTADGRPRNIISGRGNLY